MTGSSTRALTGVSTGALIITVPEAGRLLGLSRSSAYEAARRSEIPTIRIGRRLLVPVPRLMQMLGIDRVDEGMEGVETQTDSGQGQTGMLPDSNTKLRSNQMAVDRFLDKAPHPLQPE